MNLPSVRAREPAWWGRRRTDVTEAQAPRSPPSSPSRRASITTASDASLCGLVFVGREHLEYFAGSRHEIENFCDAIDGGRRDLCAEPLLSPGQRLLPVVPAALQFDEHELFRQLDDVGVSLLKLMSLGVQELPQRRVWVAWVGKCH